ncbi:hypothetical protein GCM10020358_35510 [Amorphoplanes nipponensis]|uniref:Carbohydrate binding module family 25 domain-containing protein n=1 Tax=Actinoplanes nipponensis TaxID=135950 RepID=A0A919JN12_9ACTN|nr:TIGR03086 family metal-binding protein [Actinoplanes nipponensis]GIE53621.1 hypothetical protein Ani05nite_71550 [Actinoplanes nipponensis]
MNAGPPARYDRPLQWLAPAAQRTEHALIRYTGPLARTGAGLVLHLGYDGWSARRNVPMERAGDGSWIAELRTGGRLVVDCVVRDGSAPECDNNDGADYRLWIGLDPVDAHVHVQEPGRGRLGFDSLRTAAYSGGMTHAVVSWTDNDFVDIAAAAVPWLTRLVWVRPGGPDVDSLRRRLADGAAGLKLHPAYDDYPADAAGLDPYLRVAADAGVPVTVHSGPGPADPDLIRRLAERFPELRFVLYHTYLGPPEGRRRAAKHARDLPNLYLETSWCSSAETQRLIGEVGPDRVLFGSDAATDGPEHFVRRPPNIELSENYNGGLLRLARRLAPDVTRQLLEDNARALFGLPRPQYGPAPTPERLRTLLAAALGEHRRVIAALRPGQFTHPTPCPPWDVRALLTHVLTAVERAGGASAVAAGAVRAEPDTVRRAFDAAAAHARAAWTRPGAMTGTVAGPWGPVPAAVALSGFVLELTAHAWDLAAAVGDRTPLGEDLATAAHRIATRLVPPELRDGQVFGPPVAAPAGADAGTRLAAYLGRRS